VFIDCIKNNILLLSAIFLLTAQLALIIWLTFEIKKIKRQLNENSNKQQNNVIENIDVKSSDFKKQINKKEKYSEKEIEELLIDLMMALKKTTESLDKWRTFGIIFIIVIIISIISNYIPQ
jgi:t-SNARE complex subunit (syntaxin)